MKSRNRKMSFQEITQKQKPKINKYEDKNQTFLFYQELLFLADAKNYFVNKIQNFDATRIHYLCYLFNKTKLTAKNYLNVKPRILKIPTTNSCKEFNKTPLNVLFW